MTSEQGAQTDALVTGFPEVPEENGGNNGKDNAVEIQNEIEIANKSVVGSLPSKETLNVDMHSKAASQLQNREIVPFSREDNMVWQSWLNYFNAICIAEGKDDIWKIQNIQRYLKGKALTLYINNCLNVLHWEELVDLFNEEFTDPGQISLTDFTELKFKLGENVNEYYQQKLKLGRGLGLDNRFILDGLTEGLPIQLQSLMVANTPKTTNEWRELVFKLNKLLSSTSQEPRKENVSHPTQFFRQWRPQRSNEYSLNPQARPFNYRVPFQNLQHRNYFPNQDRNNPRNVRPYLNPPRPPNTHYQEPLPPSPCKICLNYNISNAYHWMHSCPFNNHTMNPLEMTTPRFPNPPAQNVKYDESRPPVENQIPENSGTGNSGSY